MSGCCKITRLAKNILAEKKLIAIANCTSTSLINSAVNTTDKNALILSFETIFL